MVYTVTLPVQRAGFGQDAARLHPLRRLGGWRGRCGLERTGHCQGCEQRQEQDRSQQSL